MIIFLFIPGCPADITLLCRTPSTKLTDIVQQTGPLVNFFNNLSEKFFFTTEEKPAIIHESG
ncbi:MAG: hypothetical protein ACLSDK_06305 [Oscillospiraceae bacterium]